MRWELERWLLWHSDDSTWQTEFFSVFIVLEIFSEFLHMRLSVKEFPFLQGVSGLSG
jgi:hypothetical protein